MSLIIIMGVIALMGIAGLAFAAYHYGQGRKLRNRNSAYDDQVTAARAGALWEVAVDNAFSDKHTIIFVQRRARMPWGVIPHGSKIVVKSLDNDDSNYDVEMQKAMASARFRAKEFNASLEPDYITQ